METADTVQNVFEMEGQGLERYFGRASIRLEQPVEVISSASVVGTKEGQGPLGALFDKTLEDDSLGAKNWEDAESFLQKEALKEAMGKIDVSPEEIRYLFAGDLLGQSIASSFGLGEFQIPFFGIYGACSTCGEALTLGAMTIAGGFADVTACVTSSHFASAEREFRFPLEYGNQRPLSASWTVTGSGAFILRNGRQGDSPCRKEFATAEGDCVKDTITIGKTGESGMPAGWKTCRPLARICGMTVGRIEDYGIKDSMNMGACMAPAAASTILQHFQDWGRRAEDYDQIITGDLGSVGRKALLDFMRERGFDLEEKHSDCGMLIYDQEKQDVHAGGSGCGCCATVLASYILKQLREGFWKRVLFLPTGALLSKTSFNEGKTVPAICHAVVLENADL